MIKLDDHFESYMGPYVCILHTYDLHVYDLLHAYVLIYVHSDI